MIKTLNPASRSRTEGRRLNVFLAVSLLLYTLGLLFLTFWAHRRTMGHHYLFFGLFALIHGLWLFGRMVFGRYPVDWVALDFLNAFIRYTISIPIWLLLMRFLGNGWRSSMRWGLWAFVLFAPVGILWDLVHWQPFSAMRVYNVLIPFGAAVVVGNLFRHGWKGSMEVWMARVLAIVVPIAMILIFRDSCEFWGSLWFSCQRQPYMDVVTVCFLGYIVARRSWEALGVNLVGSGNLAEPE
jgi:hypothetical protein